MIPTLYEPFRHWSEGGSVYILSDFSIINGIVMKNDTFVCLGDVGNPEYIKEGVIANISSIHRITIDRPVERKYGKNIS